jgi:hypothetical protein
MARLVAVKVLMESTQGFKHDLTMLLHEANLMRQISHRCGCRHQQIA